MNITPTTIIALGANLSAESGAGPEIMLNQAISELKREPLKINAISRYFTTKAIPAGSGPDFINATILLTSQMSAVELIRILHKIEERLGRVRDRRWGPRLIDLDLIDHRGEIIPDLSTYYHWQRLTPNEQENIAPSELILPHPRASDRPFVLVPLQDIYPDWRHPISHETIPQMLGNISENYRNSITEHKR